MTVAVLGLIVVMGACACWAWHFQRRALDVIRRDMAAVKARAGALRAEAPATDDRTTVVKSVLSWARFSIVSVLACDGTAIVACRSAEEESDDEPSGGLASLPGWPQLLQNDQTLVLLMGEGDRATVAEGLLEHWRQSNRTLTLRPTGIPGAVEFFDGESTALRALLLAA